MERELDLRLKEIRGRISQADPLLVRLLNFAASPAVSLEYGLVLILDGITVMGIPGPSASTGEVLDGQSVRFFRSMQAIAMSTGGDGGNWPEIINWYKKASPYRTQARIDDEGQSKIYEKIGNAAISDPLELLDQPGNLAEEAADAFIPPKAFTLINAHIRPFSSVTWENVPNMRVSLSSVRAWWTFDLDVPEEAKAILDALEKDAEAPN
jgi:hypothetical protein